MKMHRRLASQNVNDNLYWLDGESQEPQVCSREEGGVPS